MGFPISSEELAALSPELLLTLGASVVLIWGALDRARQRPGLFAYLTIATLALAAASIWLCVLPQSRTGMLAFGNQIAVDHYGAFFSVLFLLTAALAVGASTRFLDDHRTHAPEYYFLILCAVLGMVVMARAVDFISLFVALELQALSIYVLVGFFKSDQQSNEAGLKYFILGGLASGVLLYSMSLFYAITGSTRLDTIASRLSEPALSDDRMVLVAMLLLVVALGFKIAAVPFHLWAPDAYTGAPTPVSLFISVASKAAAFAMMIRIFMVGLEPMTESWALLLAVLAAATMTFGNVAAMSQDNLKRLLAYSSIAHVGYVLMGVVAASPFGMAAALFYLLAYVFMNVGAWAILILLRRKGMASDSIADLNGLASKSYWATGAMLLFLLSLGGIPPTMGFLAKWYVFGAAIQAGWNWLVIIGVLNAVVAVYYYLRIVVAMFLTEPDGEVSLVHSTPLNVTLAVAALMTLVGIIWASPFIDWVQQSAATFF